MASAQSAVLVALLCLFAVCHGAALSNKVGRGSAGFYGAPNGEGTNGGACGYGYQTVSNFTASVTRDLWSNGAICGACYRIKSKSKAVTIKVTNFCDYTDKQCATYQQFGLSQPVYKSLSPGSAQSISVTFQRVSCTPKGAIKFVVSRNGPTFISILVDNVAQYGTLSKLEIKSKGSRKWIKTTRPWGANWAYSGSLTYPLALRLTSSGSGKVLTTRSNCISDNSAVTTFTCKVQF